MLRRRAPVPAAVRPFCCTAALTVRGNGVDNPGDAGRHRPARSIRSFSMRHARVLAVSALATAVVVAAAAFAQTTLTPLPDNGPIRTASLEVDFSKTHWGDAKAGQTKATACAACHGADGNSTVEMYPSIAGQSERYVAQQMA
jgi:cytochrome c553